MNNTINNSRLTRSNPSFGSFSQEAKKIITSEIIENLAQKGKILLSDVDYLAKHKLEIGVKNDSKIGHKGLAVINPYNAKDFGKKDPAHYQDRMLTPFTEWDTKNTFVYDKEKWRRKTLEEISETVESGLKKAVKFARKFDKFNKRKEDFLAQNGKTMTHLGTLKSNYTEMMKAETQLIIDGKSEQSKEGMDTLAQHLNSATKSLSVFEKKEEKLDTKIRSVFSWWRF